MATLDGYNQDEFHINLHKLGWSRSPTAAECVLAPANHRVGYITMTSLVAILDLKGKPLIQRSYRDDVPSSCIERFLPLVLEIEEDGQQVTPCFSNQGVNYMHIRHSNLYRE
jgi:hypothetical protein